MTHPNDKRSFDEIAKQTLAANIETQKEIARLLNTIEDIKNQRETAFRKLGITPEMEEEAKHRSPSDLSIPEQKLLDVIQREYRAELAKQGLDTELVKTEKTKSKALQTLSRKRLKI